MAGIIAKRQLGINWKAQAMNDLLKELEGIFFDGVTSRDQANDLLARCYNAITDLQAQLPKPKTEKQLRTEQQRKAIEVYCREMANLANDAGYEFASFIEHKKLKGTETPWSQELFKEYVWRPVQQAYLSKASTTRLKPEEVTVIYDVVNRKMAEIAGVSMNFPNWRG